VLIKSNGPGECLLGRTWGYEQTGVWVRDGCSGEFAFGASVQQVLTPATAPTAQAPSEPTDRIETWGEFDPGAGFLLARTDFGELSLSTYALVRWVDQMPGDQTFTDHFGNVRPVDRAQRHLPASRDYLSEGLVVETEADLQRFSVDR
jgi:hypothetical protein